MSRVGSCIALLLAACGGSAAPPTEHAGHEPAPHEREHAAHDHATDHGAHDHAAHDHAAHHPGAHGGAHAQHEHDFSDVEAFAAIFDDPSRDAWQRPEEVVERLALEPGMTVADIGAGTGYFLPHLAPAVGESGEVLALDVEPGMVAHMRSRVEEAELSNVTVREVAPDDPGLDPQSVDRVLVVNTWHHVSDRTSYARKLFEALRPGGAVLVVDFTEDSEHGPPPEMRLAPEVVVEDFVPAGFEAELVEETLPNQYVVRATRPR